MAGLIDAISGAPPPHPHRPWPRRLVDAEGWTALIEQLAAGRWTLAGLWGDVGAVHMALLDAGSGDLA
ncbi:MAG TPA: hydrogenase expression protein HypE, partial [Acetobacteraceae bacterium]